MEKLSRVEKYKELRESMDAVQERSSGGKPTIEPVELRRQLQQIDQPQQEETQSRHSHTPPRFSKEIDVEQTYDTGKETFHNEYLDDFLNEVKEYNIEKGNRLSDNTQIDILLQLNPEKKVEYSSEKTFAKGDILELDEDGRIEQNGYEGVAKKNIYGFYTVLLLPTYEYQSEIYQWTLLTGSVIFISLAILAVVAISQIWLVSHPIKVLEKEMRHFGKGDFSEAETPVQLAEYNQLFATFNQMKAQIQELIESEQRKEKEKADLELGKLMYQINPHFLMNALNSIHWMALTNHQKEIDDYVKHLGFILSYSLGKAEQNTTLRTELKYLQYYLELQQMTHDFSSEFDIAEGEYLNTRCARFLLQPIAENAVCHNMDEFGTLWVEASEQDGIITIRIRDDGKGFEISEKMEQNAKDERKGIGLRYVQMTLKSFYGEEAEMKIESELGKGTEVTLHFPVLPA